MIHFIFEKEHVFLEKTIFYPTNNPILTKVATFSESMSKIKIMLAGALVLLFLDFSSYLEFQLSAWKRGCTISVKLQMMQTLSTSFWKPLTKLYKGK